MSQTDMNIEATQYTPAIAMNTSGEMSLIGKSYPENTFDFYKPILQWLKDFLSNEDNSELNATFEITYFNSSSSKIFFDIFDLFDEFSDNVTVNVVWRYEEENEFALEAGEDFIEDFPDMNIKLVEIL